MLATKDLCIGWLIITPEIQEYIHTEIIHVNGVAEAEKMATTECLDQCRKSGISGPIIVYTDHEGSFKKEEEWKHEISVPPSGDIQIQLVRGHQKSVTKSNIDLIFTRVDRLTRKLLRQHIKSLE